MTTYKTHAAVLGSRLTIFASGLTLAGWAAAQTPSPHLIADGDPIYEIRHEEAASSPHDDFSPVLYEGAVVFVSGRKPPANRTVLEDTDHGHNFTSLFSAPADADGRLGPAVEFDRKLNDVFHDATPTFTADGNTVFFTRSHSRGARRIESKDGRMKLGIYRAVREGEKWSDPELLPFSTPESTEMHPTVNADGTVLYFASDREGGFGGTDLYVARRTGETWSKPENLGPQVNLPGREAFPHLAPDGSLYYSSDDGGVLGHFDVYRTEDNGRGGFEVGVPLPEPLNGPGDDVGFVLHPAGDRGYLASSRAGLGGDDLYSFTVTPPPYRAPVGEILAYIGDGTDSLLANVSLTLDAVGPAILPTEDAPGRYRLMTNADGHAELDLSEGLEYEALVYRHGFDTLRTRLSFDSVTYAAAVHLVRLTPKPDTPATEALVLDETNLKPDAVFGLPNIFYDYDEASLRPDAQHDLDSLVAVMLRFPSLTVELRSHTDARGPRAYNQRLSEARAESARAYLLENAIAAERVSLVGFGETQPRVPCATDDACDEDEHQLNRRTEVRIVSIDGVDGVEFEQRVTGEAATVQSSPAPSEPSPDPTPDPTAPVGDDR